MSESAVEKAELARANTMQITAKEGEAFLDKNLTEWKKPALMEHFEEGGQDSKAEGDGETSHLAKHTTMIETAKEGKELLGGEVLGDTRQETKKRQSKEKTNVKRVSTIDKVLLEAKAVYTDLDTSSEGRSLRKRPPPPPAKEATPPVKKTNTMTRTAKEGEEFLKRTKKSPKKGAKKQQDEEDADESAVAEENAEKAEESAEKAADKEANSHVDGEKAHDGDHETRQHKTSDQGAETARSDAEKTTASIVPGDTDTTHATNECT